MTCSDQALGNQEVAGEEYTLSELTEAAGVSVRTVRYYIAEGLLPPPESAGPRATYSRTHLIRLLLIGQLKEAYLPLREIRRYLDEMSDAEIEDAIRADDIDVSEIHAPHILPLREDAASYIEHALRQSPLRKSRSTPSRQLRDRWDPNSPSGPPPATPPQYWKGNVAGATPADARTRHQRLEEGTAWRRIELGPDAELLVREDAYERKRDRVEWLINWAKRVFN